MVATFISIGQIFVNYSKTAQFLEFWVSTNSSLVKIFFVISRVTGTVFRIIMIVAYGYCIKFHWYCIHHASYRSAKYSRHGWSWIWQEMQSHIRHIWIIDIAVERLVKKDKICFKFVSSAFLICFATDLAQTTVTHLVASSTLIGPFKASHLLTTRPFTGGKRIANNTGVKTFPFSVLEWHLIPYKIHFFLRWIKTFLALRIFFGKKAACVLWFSNIRRAWSYFWSV